MMTGFCAACGEEITRRFNVLRNSLGHNVIGKGGHGLAGLSWNPE